MLLNSKGYSCQANPLRRLVSLLKLKQSGLGDATSTSFGLPAYRYTVIIDLLCMHCLNVFQLQASNFSSRAQVDTTGTIPIIVGSRKSDISINIL